MIMTTKGSLIPSVFFGSAGHITYVVLRGRGGGGEREVMWWQAIVYERRKQIQ